MGAISKKRISTSLFQIALILTLMNSESYYPADFYLDLESDLPLQPQSVELNNNRYLSELNVTEDLGHAYYSRASAYHRRSEEYDLTTPYLSIKRATESSYDPIPDNNASNEFVPNDNYYRQRILEELRSLSVRRYSNLPRERTKATLAFQNITAYLVSNTNATETNGLGTVPELRLTLGPSSTPTIDSSLPSFIPLSIIEDTEEGIQETIVESEDPELGTSRVPENIGTTISLDTKGNGFDDILRAAIDATGLSLLEDEISPMEIDPPELEFDLSTLSLELPTDKPVSGIHIHYFFKTYECYFRKPNIQNLKKNGTQFPASLRKFCLPKATTI